MEDTPLDAGAQNIGNAGLVMGKIKIISRP
jgi:hypothetical protein